MKAIAQRLERPQQSSSIQTLIHRRVDLRPYTSLRIGGTAEYFIAPDTLNEIVDAIALARVMGIPMLVLGNGTNLLIPDSGFPGLVVHIGRNFGQMRLVGDALQVQAGASLGTTMGFLRAHGFRDFDGLVGIPGSIGGALVMNAGIPEFSISQRVKSVTVLKPDGTLVKLSREDCAFGYRTSRFQENDWMIISAAFEIGQDEHLDTEELMRRRRERQPLRWTSPGCVFKNPEGTPGAGWLIEHAGLKGAAAGGAMISPLHANFIVNRGRSTAFDVLQLIDCARKKVYKEFGVELQLEVAVVSDLR